MNIEGRRRGGEKSEDEGYEVEKLTWKRPFKALIGEMSVSGIGGDPASSSEGSRLQRFVIHPDNWYHSFSLSLSLTVLVCVFLWTEMRL